MLSKLAVLETQTNSHRAEQLARGTAAQRFQASVLLQRNSIIRETGLSSDEARALYTDALRDEIHPKRNEPEYRKKFDAYLRATIGDVEMRQFLAGSQSITYTEGAAGGYTVPIEYDPTLFEAMAQVDPILSVDVTSFSMTDGPTLQPEQISGFDLSSISASIVGEATQQSPQSIPPVAGETLRSDIIFKVTFSSSWEVEIDVPDFTAKVVRAASVALARRIGRSIISGRAGSDINGITHTLGSANLWNATPGKITLTDLNNFYFSINRWYRSQPKCGWLMTDSTYEMVRAATDNSGRPLLDVSSDDELLLGKRIYVSPSLATTYTSIGLTGALVFGDLSHLVIRMSRPQIQHSEETPGADISKGLLAWIGRARADAAIFDPSGGSAAPLTLVAIN